jgi:hypothetical protein
MKRASEMAHKTKEISERIEAFVPRKPGMFKSESIFTSDKNVVNEQIAGILAPSRILSSSLSNL